MAWPFPDPVRPAMRSYLLYVNRFMSEYGRQPSDEEALAYLTGPAQSIAPQYAEPAMAEARRSKLFAENVEAFGGGQQLGALWDRYWLSIFTQAYGRAPTASERHWAQSRPGDVVGVMVAVTVEGVDDFRYTPTLNVPWDVTLEEIQAQVRDWFLTGLRSPPPPGTVGAAIEGGARVNVNLIGGALVPRIEPTITLTRG